MSAVAEADSLDHIRRQLRVIGILTAAGEAGLIPLGARQLQTVGFFADALAPVWGVQILDAQLLKRRDSPNSSVIQADIDRLVGLGVLIATDIRHSEDADGLWRLEANYALNAEFAEPILAAARQFDTYARELAFLAEVVLALAGFGALEINRASNLDASYGDAIVDPGSMVDLANAEGNRTARVAVRFGELVSPDISLSDSEMIHLYLRELYKRLSASDE